MKSKYLAIALLTSFSNICFSQTELFSDLSNYKYFVGTHEPDAEWNKLSFDDSSWQITDGSIGYGQADVKTTVQTTTSVYLRYNFTIPDKSLVNSLCLYADFNDGFVAYINGKEIARENLRKSSDKILFYDLADRSHKANAYRNYFQPINGYYIDDPNVLKSLNDGDNILSVQVHNDSVSGSDLFFSCKLFDYSNYRYGIWDYHSYIKQVPLDSSLFPIVVINTDAYGIPTDSLKYKAFMGIINNSQKKYNKLEDAYTDYNGNISINIRGASSKQIFPKKSFSIETQDELGENKNVSLLGMPAENDWKLISNFNDISLIRNELAANIGRRQGHYQPRTRYCELILNGKYLGLYVLTEKVKRDSSRVNIEKLASGEVDGGYLLEINSNPNELFDYVYPKPSVIEAEQKEYINSFYKEFIATTDSSYFADPIRGFSKYIDPQSLIDYIIAQECMSNMDGYVKSLFLYKNKSTTDERLKLGPLWDHDLCFITNQQYFKCTQLKGNDYLSISNILRDTAFVHRLQNRWFELRKGVLQIDSMNYLIDSLTSYIAESRKRNFEVWPVMNGNLFVRMGVKNYEEEIDNLKTWIKSRFTWIDENISKIYFPINTYITADNESSINVFPIPFSDKLNINLQYGSSSALSFNIHDIVGQCVYSQNCKSYNGAVVLENLSTLSRGVYFLTIKENGKVKYTSKLVK